MKFSTHQISQTTPPTLRVLAIGISDYQDDQLDLGLPAKDAKDFTTTIEEAYRTRTSYQIETMVLTDGDATRDSILSKGAAFLSQGRPDDIACVFLAGHGMIDRDGEFRFCPTDVDLENLKTTAVAYQEIESVLSGAKGQRRFLFIDSCHAGGIGRGEVPASSESNIRQVAGPKEIQETALELRHYFMDFQRQTGTSVLAAAQGHEFAHEPIEGEVIQNGYFTHCLRQALKGSVADRNGDGKISFSEVSAHTGEAVALLSDRQQNPVFRELNPLHDHVLVPEDDLQFRGQNFVRNFLRGSSDGRIDFVSKQFAPSARYFENVMTPDQIRQDNLAFGAGYCWRRLQLASPVEVSRDPEDPRLVDVHYTHRFIGNKREGKRVERISRMAMKLREDGEGSFQIVELGGR